MQQQKSFQQNKTLFLVPTPIGNLDDMTIRAKHTLENVALIAAEDTRHTQKLLNHFNIHTPQISFHEHNFKERIPYLIERLLQGDTVAQVSDAGMPSISDPGYELVQACLQAEIAVVALPGANAALTALIASGIAPQPFYFHGFLPRKKNEQLAMLQTLKPKTETLIFYESPFRIKETLQNMQTAFNGNRQAVISRELTKKYEEYLRGTIDELVTYLNNETLKGELCLVVSGLSGSEQHELEQQSMHTLPENLSEKECVDWAMSHHQLNNKEAIKWVAKQLNRSKQDIYKCYHQS